MKEGEILEFDATVEYNGSDYVVKCKKERVKDTIIIRE
jgi:hypothetical protein